MAKSLYIDYTYYLENSGTITDEAAFNSYNRQVQNYVDWATFNRLLDFDVIPDRVKQCIIDMVDKLNYIDQFATVYDGKVASAISNSGVSVSFPTATISQIEADKENSMYQMVLCGLYGVRTDDGLQITYRGV